MRKLLERIARAMPSAAKATTEAEQRAAIASVWPDLIECAARMNGTPTDDCWSYVAASDGMAKAREIMAAEYPDYPLFTAYWRVWWTAAARLGRPVAVEQIVDNTMAEDAAEAALDRLKSMAYVAYYGEAELPGTGFQPGWSAFIDCEACQQWRFVWRQGTRT